MLFELLTLFTPGSSGAGFGPEIDHDGAHFGPQIDYGGVYFGPYIDHGG